MDRVITCRLPGTAQRIRGMIFSDLNGSSQVGIIVDSQIAFSLFNALTRLAEILAGTEQQLASVVIRSRMCISICVGGIYRATFEDRLGRVRYIQGNESTIPVRNEDQLSIIRRLCPMPIIGI